MDFLLELIFGIFVEAPLDAAMESKRIKPWVKTLLIFIVGNILTVILVLIAWNQRTEGEVDPFAVGFAAVWFVAVTAACVFGHRRKWTDQNELPVPQPVPELRNEPKAGLTIRTAAMTDLEQIAQVEAACFPAAEAATKEVFRQRLKYYPNHFWLMFDCEKLISFVDGFVTNEPDLTDEMFANPALHNEAGRWQMIFGVNALPEYRRHGYAGQLIRQAIADAKEQGRKGVVLTCKPEKVPYYLQFGFVNEGISRFSTHGGAVWHQMRLTF